MLIASSRPSFALVLDNIPATSPRPRSSNNPSSSTRAMSYPDAWPAVLSADRNSTDAHGETATRGTRPKRIPSSPLAVAIASICAHSSPDFSRERDATPQRVPCWRSGPSSASIPSKRIPTHADFEFFLATNSPPSRMPGFMASRSQDTAKAGNRMGSPAFACPGGTIRRVSLHCASASAGSSGQGGLLTSGSGSRTSGLPVRSALRLARRFRIRCALVVAIARHTLSLSRHSGFIQLFDIRFPNPAPYAVQGPTHPCSRGKKHATCHTADVLEPISTPGNDREVVNCTAALALP